MNLQTHYQHLYQQEHENQPRSQFRKRNRFALVYPSTYELGMSSLGVQVIYATLNGRADTSCERAFVPEANYLRKLIAQKRRSSLLRRKHRSTSLTSSGFSVSFESDYVNIPRALEFANIPPLAEERSDWEPLVIAGGINISYNPEPIADFVDVFVVGEAEVIIHELMEHFDAWKQRGASKTELLETSQRCPGSMCRVSMTLSITTMARLKGCRPSAMPTRVSYSSSCSAEIGRCANLHANPYAAHGVFQCAPD